MTDLTWWDVTLSLIHVWMWRIRDECDEVTNTWWLCRIHVWMWRNRDECDEYDEYVMTYQWVTLNTWWESRRIRDGTWPIIAYETSWDVTHSCAWHASFTHVTCPMDNRGWQRPIGCIVVQVSLRKWATIDRALLRKMTCNRKALLCRCLSANDLLL